MKKIFGIEIESKTNTQVIKYTVDLHKLRGLILSTEERICEIKEVLRTTWVGYAGYDQRELLRLKEFATCCYAIRAHLRGKQHAQKGAWDAAGKNPKRFDVELTRMLKSEIGEDLGFCVEAQILDLVWKEPQFSVVQVPVKKTVIYPKPPKRKLLSRLLEGIGIRKPAPEVRAG